ncbi:MAG: hypothetical protein ACK2VA_17905, partial [Anaerolineae bacterium]
MNRRRTGQNVISRNKNLSHWSPTEATHRRTLAQGVAFSIALVLPLAIVLLAAWLLAPDSRVAAQSADGPITIDCIPPSVELSKVASPYYLYEPGGTFVFTLTVTNKSEDSVKITSLTDSQADEAVDFAQCNALIGTYLSPGQSASCAYSVVHTNAGTYPNEAGVTVKNDYGEACDTASASVKVKNVMPTITVVKTADPVEVPEPGGLVTFIVEVTNDSVECDPVEIMSLVDSIHGDLSTQGTCTDAIGTVLQPGETYACAFSAQVTGSAGYVETDVVTATAKDDDCNTVEDSDDAIVTIVGGGLVPSITVVKTADPTEVPEPGGLVTFTVEVTNDS